ncbi:MAG: FAD:protein FMN transferase [Chthoniobacteraceae bacterium]
MKWRSNSVRRARPLLGTIVEIQVAGLGERECHAAIETAFATVEEVQQRMSFHEPTSTLSRLNRLAALAPMRVDAWTWDVLRFAEKVHRVSGGLFDVTIAPVLQAQGFLPAGESDLPGTKQAAPSFADVQFLPDRMIRFHHPGVRIDLGGIAKGFAVDQAVATLCEAGVPRGLVNAGGDLRAFGEEPFPVVIRHPDAPSMALAEIDLCEAALATSAHYFAERQVPGAAFAPIIHPTSGQTARAVRTATVRAATAMAADALTKVVMLAGEAALPILEQFDADAIFVAEGGQAMCSPGFHATLELSA